MCSAEPKTEPRLATIARGSDLLFGLLVCGVFAAAIGMGLAWSPEALRRPLLTPAAVGVGVGLLIARLGFPRRKITYVLAALLPMLALGLMHHQFFRRIELAASERLAREPAALAALELQSHLAPHEAISSGEVRRLRLALAPRLSDYLIERSTSFLGGEDWPLAAGFAAIELLLAAGISVATVSRTGALTHAPAAEPSDSV